MYIFKWQLLCYSRTVPAQVYSSTLLFLSKLQYTTSVSLSCPGSCLLLLCQLMYCIQSFCFLLLSQLFYTAPVSRSCIQLLLLSQLLYTEPVPKSCLPVPAPVYSSALPLLFRSLYSIQITETGIGVYTAPVSRSNRDSWTQLLSCLLIIS